MVDDKEENQRLQQKTHVSLLMETIYKTVKSAAAAVTQNAVTQWHTME